VLCKQTNGWEKHDVGPTIPNFLFFFLALSEKILTKSLIFFVSKLKIQSLLTLSLAAVGG
jgi:hypothetical protein